MVGAGQALFNVVNIDNLKLKITVDEAQVSRLHVGDKVQVKPSTEADTIEGKIVFIAPKSDGALKFPVEILVSNKDKSSALVCMPLLSLLDKASQLLPW
mgnify:CR=1 FL=1